MKDVGPGQYALMVVDGRSSGGHPAPIAGTVRVTDYQKAYVASAGVADQYVMVPKVVVNPGDFVAIDVAFNATASDGSVLSELVVSFQVVGGPALVATELVLEDVRVLELADSPVPPDPGSDTIPIF